MGRLRGGDLKLIDQKIDQGGRSLALIWAYDLLLSCFAYSRIEMHGSG